MADEEFNLSIITSVYSFILISYPLSFSPITPTFLERTLIYCILSLLSSQGCSAQNSSFLPTRVSLNLQDTCNHILHFIVYFSYLVNFVLQ